MYFFTKKLNKLIAFISIIIFFLIFLSANFYIIKYNEKGKPDFSNKFIMVELLTVLFALIGLTIYRFLRKYINKNTIVNKASKNITLLFSICLFIATIFQIINLNFDYYEQFDKDFLFSHAVKFAKTGNFDWKYASPNINAEDILYFKHFPGMYTAKKSIIYYSKFPNTWASTLFFCYIFRLSYLIFGNHISNIFFKTAAFINILSFIISSIFMLLIIKKVFKNNKSAQIICILALFTQHTYYSYSIAFYTDTLVMPFILSSIYFFISFLENKNQVKSLLLLITCCTILSLGYHIKGSCIILIIALAIYGFLKINFKKTISFLLLTIILLLIFGKLIETITFSSGFVKKEDFNNNKAPMLRWVCVSINHEFGRLNPNVDKQINKIKGTDAKNSFCKNSIQLKLKEFGVKGTIVFLVKKTGCTWSGYLKRTVSDTLYHPIKKAWNNTMLLFILIGFISSFLQNKINPLIIFRLSIIGIAVFLMVWESRPRYLMSFSYLFFITETEGVIFTNYLVDKIRLKHNIISN